MSRRSLGIAMLIGLIWLGVVPLAFVTLYSVLEMQAAARAVGGEGATKLDPRLATLRVAALGLALDQAEASGWRRQALERSRDQLRVALFEARSDARVAAADILSLRGVSGAMKACTAPQDVQTQCQIGHKMDVCAADWTLITECAERAMLMSRDDPKMARDLDTLRAVMKTARRKGFEFNSVSARLRDSKLLEANSLMPVAESYRAIHLPFFKWLFILPEGVVVACFTAVMASLGAGVSSLAALLRRHRSAADTDAYLLRAFLFSPLLGALAGFMVYFVVSAGTAFLVPPDQDSGTDAVNNLSVPALASLGVFAGLGAEHAIGWLTGKAKAFFEM